MGEMQKILRRRFIVIPRADPCPSCEGIWFSWGYWTTFVGKYECRLCGGRAALTAHKGNDNG